MPNSPPKILVVDDNPATLYATSRVLKSAGFETVEADCGLAAVEAAQRGVDVVVLDINLPDIDGFEVCRRIRVRDDLARTPVIHLSATFVKDVDKVTGLEAGADGYLTHPVEPPVLIATVNAFLRTRQAEEAMRRSESKYRAVFENALDGILLIDKNSIYTDANPAMCRILGRSREEIIGKTTSDFVPADFKAKLADIKTAIDQTASWRGTFPMLASNGQRVYLDWSAAPFSADGARVAIVSDVTERIRAEEQRQELLASERDARAEAEKANRVKDEFLATLSHELRTPLNAIVGWSQLLRGGHAEPDELQEGLEAIERNAKVQTQLIADLLDVSRITSGKLRLDIQSVDPASMINAAIDAVMHSVEAKGLQLKRLLDPNAGPVLGDPARLQQIVWNLVANAVKFTPRGGKITVTLGRSNSEIHVTVSDTGQGVNPELLPHMFERFRQGDATSTRTHGGLGLGLAIVKHLVEMHGGTVAAESPGEGQGATFTVRLPVSAVRRQQYQPAAHPTTDPAGFMPGFRGTDLSGIHVLIVDDDADARALLRRLLAECGAEVADADCVAQAMLKLDEFQPHVLVSDIGMPIRDGYDLIHQVRSRGYTFQVLPAVALTAFARPDDRRRALLAGYQVHVSKPVDPSELMAAIATLVGRTGAHA